LYRYAEALRKAERWAAAVGATPPPKVSGASFIARRAVGGLSNLGGGGMGAAPASPLGSLDTVVKGGGHIMPSPSPSKRITWWGAAG
jgi:hypothetical protein